MDPYVSRAFLNRWLSTEQKNDLRKSESAMQGRYLTGSEVCRRYHLSTKMIPEPDLERMEVLLWKWRKIWEAKFDSAASVPYSINHDHLLGDLWDWEAFADENFQEMLPSYDS